ncbi:MAG: MFS transporter [Pseudolabrys sp.]
MSSKASVFGLLDEAPMTGLHYYYWLLASGGTLLDGFSVVSLGIAIPLLKQDMTITPVFVGLIGSALVLGAVLGAMLGGIAADRIGRKHVFIADMAIMVVGSVLCTMAHEPSLILVGQFLIGVGIGIDFPASGSYVSEIMPHSLRSRMTVATIALQSVGMILAVLGTGGLLAALYMCARLFLPESLRWLAEKGRLAEAAKVLSRLTRTPASVTRLENSESAAIAPIKSLGFAALFSPRYRTRTLLESVPWLMMDVATYGVGLFTPVILGAMHFDSARSGTVAAVLGDAEGSGLVDLFLLAGFIVGIWAIPRFGRIPLQVTGFAGMALGMLLLMFAAMALGMLLLMFAAMAGDGPQGHLGLIIAGFVLFNFAMNAGPNATTFTLPPVLFPTAIRASASGFAAACAKVGATFGTFLVPQLQAAWGLTGVLALMAFVSIGGLLATAALHTPLIERTNLKSCRWPSTTRISPRDECTCAEL